MKNKGASSGQWIGATLLAVLIGIPSGMCNAVWVAEVSNSATAAYIAWGATIFLTLFLGLGMIITEGEKRELRRRRLDDLRERQN